MLSLPAGLAAGQPARAEGLVARIARSGEVVMGAPTDLPPLIFRDAAGAWSGYAVDVGKAIAAELSGATGRPVQLRVQPVSDPRALFTGVADGSLTLVCGVPFTWEADALVDYSLPIAVSGLRLLAPAGRLDGSPASLRGRRIGVVKNSLAATELRGIQPEARAVEFTTLQEAVVALRAGRVEGVIGDSTLLVGMARSQGAQGLVLTPDQPYETYSIACMLPENDSSFRNLVNLAIARRIQGYVDGDPRTVAAVHRWVGPGGIREVPAEQLRGVFEMILSTVEQLRPLPPQPAPTR
jgi:polar amino acid transport system substrate-binding protein